MTRLNHSLPAMFSSVEKVSRRDEYYPHPELHMPIKF